MEIEMIQERQNPFFKRKDIVLSMKHGGQSTPSKADVAKELASKYNVDELQIQIDYIFSKKGISESLIKAKVLDEKPKVEVKEEQKAEEPKGEISGETQSSSAE